MDKKEIIVAEVDKSSELDGEVKLIDSQVHNAVINTRKDFDAACELLKQIKDMQKQVAEYWGPLVKAAHEAHKQVKARENAMKKPLEKAEDDIKQKIAVYLDDIEKRRQEAEIAMRRLAQQEVDRKLDEAIAASSEGDLVAAEFAMNEAEIMDDVAMSGSVQNQFQPVNGISASKTWKITNIDSDSVPVRIGDTIIRPIDEKAILSLIKKAQGQISIPGITFEETTAISIRGTK